MKLFIPTIGTHIKLTSDWSFDLFCEQRNASLIDIHYKGTSLWGPKYSQVLGTIVFPKETVMRIERIYIRGSSKADRDFDSVTFRVKSFPDDSKTKKIRFWAKLHDVNQIECEFVDE